MSFTLEEIQAEAKRQLKLQAEQEESQRRLTANAALQEALAKEERLRNERLRLLAEEEQVRELAKRLMIEAEAKNVTDAKERAVQKEIERLRNRTPLEILEDKVRELQDSITSAPITVPPPKPVEDNLVKTLQERVNLLERLVLDNLQFDIIRGYSNDHNTCSNAFKLSLKRYKEKRNIPNYRKFLINIHIQSDDRKEWHRHFSSLGCSDPLFSITPDFTTNSIRFYKQTGQWPHNTIGLIPFKTLGFDNKATKYSLIITFTSETVEITNMKAEGESFRWNFTIDDIYLWGMSSSYPDCSIEEVYE